MNKTTRRDDSNEALHLIFVKEGAGEAVLQEAVSRLFAETLMPAESQYS